ncbi:hypothetical protein IFR05_004530 [Cadophora sp. M221]|nr:hypothetical protein IFR05_004530 [Cadophora sp. M221]
MFSPARIVFWLAVMLHGVNALNAAAPYEMTYLYYAYKMEFLTVPAASRRIAPGCYHSPVTGNIRDPRVQISINNEATALAEGVVGICTFSEFMDHVETNATINNPITRTLNPDADRLATTVNDITSIRNNRLLTLPERIFSEAKLASLGGRTVSWAKQLQTISSIVETSREEMAKRLKLNPGDAVVQDAADRFQTWAGKAINNLSAVHQFRVGDQARYLVPDQQAHVSWSSSPMSAHGVIDSRQYLRMDGVPTQPIRSPGAGLPLVADATFQVVNFEASFAAVTAADSPLTSAQKKALKGFIASYGTISGSQAKLHRDVTDTVKFARDLHLKPIPTSLLDSLGDCVSCCVVS